MIQGHIIDQETGAPVQSALVTNGRDVVSTEEDGCFSLPDPVRYGPVSVCLPDDYERIDTQNETLPSGDTHVSIRARSVQQPRSFDFIHLTDAHLHAAERERTLFQGIVDDIAALHPKPSFIINGGDITLQGGGADTFRAALAPLELPVYHCVGNHEVIATEDDVFAPFIQAFGPAWYAFNYGGLHVIVLRGVEHYKVTEKAPDWIGRISDDELTWLRNHLPHVPAGKPIVVAVHMPFVSTWDLRWPQPEALRYATTIKETGEIMELFAQYGVAMVLSGHTHDNEQTQVGSTEHVVTAAACGSWWKGPNIDDTPNGYRIVRVRESEITTAYKCAGSPESHQFEIDLIERVDRDSVRIGVNVFDGREQTRVYVCANDSHRITELTKLTPGDSERRLLRKSHHYWMGTASARELQDADDLRVRVEDDRWGALEQAFELE
jgi:3',5'-cyclic-AMP phosphodiesterase